MKGQDEYQSLEVIAKDFRSISMFYRIEIPKVARFTTRQTAALLARLTEISSYPPGKNFRNVVASASTAFTAFVELEGQMIYEALWVRSKRTKES